jgi:hypothetical protein
LPADADAMTMERTRDQKRLLEVRHQIATLAVVSPDDFNIRLRNDGLTRLEAILAHRIATAGRERTI